MSLPTPAHGHRDAQWYRRAATKASAAPPDVRHEGRATDDAAWGAVSHLGAGILVYGALGWLLGHWLGNESAFAAGGVLLGTALALYLVYARLGSTRPQSPTLPRDDARGTEDDTHMRTTGPVRP